MNFVGIYIGKTYYFKSQKTYHILIDNPHELSKIDNCLSINCACILDKNILTEPFINQYVLIKDVKPFNIIIKLFTDKEIQNYIDITYPKIEFIFDL